MAVLFVRELSLLASTLDFLLAFCSDTSAVDDVRAFAGADREPVPIFTVRDLETVFLPAPSSPVDTLNMRCGKTDQE